MKLIILTLMFLTLSALLIISNNNLHLNNKKELKIFIDSYADWADAIYLNFQNIAKSMIKTNWLPE